MTSGKNSIAIRQANNVYNQSLIASFIEYNGLENVEKWLKKFVKNFVRPPQETIELKFYL